MKIPPFKREFSHEEFGIWRSIVEDYIMAKGIEDTERKIATLRVLGGMELAELLRDLPQYTEPEAGRFVSLIMKDEFLRDLDRLECFFDQKVNPIKEKCEFRNLVQSSEEKVRDYVLRLRKKARLCSFADPEREIFDQFIAGTSDKILKRKALLNKILNVDQALEEGSINETLNAADRPKPTAEVNAVASSSKTETRKINCFLCKAEGHMRKDCPKKRKRELTCFVCSKVGHIAARCEERNKDLKCYGCGGVGHAVAVCPSRTKDTKKAKLELKAEAVNFMNGGKIVDCVIGGVKLAMLVDSGCNSNIIDKLAYEILCLKKANIGFIENTDKSFTPFGSDVPIKMLGSFMAELNVGSKTIPAKFYVVDIKARCLLGMESAEELGLLKIGMENVSINE